MKKVLIVIVAFIAVVNVVLNMYNRNEILGLSSLRIEALARLSLIHISEPTRH